MVLFCARRILWAIPVLFLVALITFTLMHQAPGGPFDADGSRKQVNERTLRALNAYFGLDKPPYINTEQMFNQWQEGDRNPFSLTPALIDSQFGNYLLNALQGDLGPSYRQRGKHVQDILLEQWPYSLRLGSIAIVVMLVGGLPLGVLAAMKQNTWFDHLSRLITTVGIAIPAFVLGLLVLVIFGTQLQWIAVATSDWDTWPPYLAPGLVLGFVAMAGVTRITRAAVLEVRHHDYIRTARAKGLSPYGVIGRHMLRNAAIPVITVLAPLMIDLLLGAIIIEAVFGVPGIGRFFVESIDNRDYSMIMGTTLVYATAIVLGTLLVDICYSLIDPRIRTQG